MPPSRSGRWQANFFAKKVRAVRFQLRSAAVNGRAAAGSAADFFTLHEIFSNNKISHANLCVQKNRRYDFMKKLCVIAAAAVIGMFSLYASGKDVSYKAGTYRESAKGNNGDVTLDVTFSKNAIKSIKVVSHKETPGLSDPAFAKIPDAIVKKQTLAVDAVSGATNTSRAILEAVEKAVKAAGGDAAALKK